MQSWFEEKVVKQLGETGITPEHDLSETSMCYFGNANLKF